MGTRSLAESLGQGHTAAGWAKDFLTAIGAPANERNINAVVAWETQESGGGGGQYNPLNTTQSGYNGETSINSVGVKSYVTYADGIAANAHAFNSGASRGLYGYGDILAALNDQSLTMFDIFGAIDRSSWGTKGLPSTPGGPVGIKDVTGTGGTPGIGDGSSSSSSTDGTAVDTGDHCLITLPGTKLLGLNIGGGCLYSTSNGRAWLGAVSLTGGLFLMLVGLGFVALGGRPGKVLTA